MKKTSNRWIHIVLLCLMAVMITASGSLPARAGSVTPEEMLQRAWLNAKEAGSYRFISDINQTLIPRPVTWMIGQQETALNLALDGAVVLPDQGYITLEVISGPRSGSVSLLRDGGQSFMFQDGELRPVENTLSLASQSNDVLGYLAAADQVTLLEPPPGHPELSRYGFVINGPRYAEYVRSQAEAALRAEPGAPQGLTVKPLPTLQQLSGQGELWVNQAGLPVRQVLDLEMPEVTDEYGARIRMSADFSAFGRIEALPRAVQGPDGGWRLEGSLEAETAASLGAFPGFGVQPAQVVEGGSTTAWWMPFVPRLPLQVSPTSMLLFAAALLVVIIVRYYRRNPRRCYALVVFVLIPILVFSPLLQSAGMIKFMERQVRAAEMRAAAVPDLLRGLGFEMQEIESAIAYQKSSSTEARTSEAEAATASLGTPFTARSLANAAASLTPLQTTSQTSKPSRCGEGEPGVDTDGDGLSDQTELCLGTNPSSSDTDGDTLPDKLELDGFTLNGQQWYSDPLKPDSNEDGLADNQEWAAADAPLGRAAGADLDGDGIPNVWDDDDDGDGVPDALDISPFAVTNPAPVVSLSTQGNGFNGYQFIEVQVQPVNTDHLRYSTTALDWPPDELGNIKDLDNSLEDLRLSPFLKVRTNVQPAEELLEEYGLMATESDGQVSLLIPMMPVKDGGAIHAFYGKVAYAPGQTEDIQWQAELVWMTQAQHDSWVYRYYSWDPYHHYPQFAGMKTDANVVHQYQDEFRLTGLKITKDQGFEAAVLGTPARLDDLELFKVLVGLRQVFQGNYRLEGQEAGETALQEIAERFATYSEPNVYTFDANPSSVAMTSPISYDRQDTGLIGIGTQVPAFLDQYHATYDYPRCPDADGDIVACASLVIAYQQSLGVQDLADLPLSDGLVTTDLSQLHINLADVPVLEIRGAQMRMYEKGSNSAWQMINAARMIELVEQRYKDTYATALRDLYPGLEADDLRLIAYTAYMWATSPSYKVIALDGQFLVPEDADEAQLALLRALPPEVAGQATDAVNYVGLSTGIVAALGAGAQIAWGLDSMRIAFSGWEFFGGALLAVSVAFSTVMAIVNSICSNTSGCLNQDVLKAFTIAAASLAILAQLQAVLDLTIKVITKIAIAGVQAAKNAMKAMSAVGAVGLATQVIGIVVSIGISVVMFALALAFGGDDPVLWRVALATMVVTIVWQVVLFLINFIPFGALINAILCLIDMILGLIFNLLGLEQFAGIAQLIVGMFYSAEAVTSLKSVEFGEFSSGLGDPDMGLVGGNTYQLLLPASGVVEKKDKGLDYDLNRSWVKGVLVDQTNTTTFEGEDMSQPPECENDGDLRSCSNTASLGYALRPSINGAISFIAKALYATVWAEYMFWGTTRVNSHVSEGELPEDPEASTIYLDVLPATVSELWAWDLLTNPDRDGDGLTNDQEAALGTDPDLWDTDGDGLSDSYEWETAAELGADPLSYDTDGDGLSDSLERRLGTKIDLADTDGDGLSDSEEVHRYEAGAMVGGWQVSLPEGLTYWVSSDPRCPDADSDGLNDAEEKGNNLNPKAANAEVPSLRLSAEPVRGLLGGRTGAYWLPGEAVTFTVTLGNYASTPITQTLSLTLPDWLDTIAGGELQGDQTLPMNPPAGNTLTWPFSEAHPLRPYESVSTTITARVNPATLSANSYITLELVFGDVQLRKMVNAVVDGDHPNVAIIAPIDGGYLRGTHYVVGGSASDQTTWVTETSLSIVPGGDPSSQALPLKQGPWAYTWQLPGDGVYTLQAWAKDAMGYETTTAAVSVTVDNTPPVTTVASDMASGTVRLSGTATDNLSGIHWVQVSLDGQPWRSVPLDGSSWSYDWTVGDGAQGKHQVLARAIDRAGNESATVSLEIVVDSVAPSSIVNAGADHDLPPAVRPDTSFTLGGVADEGGHLPLPASPADLRSGMDVFDDSAVWLGLSTIHENDGGVLAAWIGDINADRLSDLAVGLPGPEGDGGYVSVLYGRAGGWPVPPDLEMLAKSPMRFNGAPGARLGSLLAAAGDANGDSLHDLLVGERLSSRAFLVFGNPRPLGGVTLDAGQSAYRVMLHAPDTITGLASAGDVNGDGYGDLLISTVGSAYLVLGHAGPWLETLDIQAEAVARFDGITGALGLGDVDNDQHSEWATLASGAITLYGWNPNRAAAEAVSTFSTADTDPRAVALGDVNADGLADWIYSDGASRILVYGGGATHTFSGYDGFFAAPGDVDGDRRADILLSDGTGLATLVGQPAGGSPTPFATIEGVGGAANAPYETGADLNSDGSADLLLIPSQAAAGAHGFDAPDFSSGFISPQTLPLGTSLPALSQTSFPSLSQTSLSSTEQDLELLALRSGEWSGEMQNTSILSSYTAGTSTLSTIMLAGQPDTRYVDDDEVCDGNSPCYETIQEAVAASDGGSDTIIVYPGVYAAFSVPAGTNYDHLTVEGVSADAVFVEGGTGDAIRIAADGVRISTLTVRNATGGVRLLDGAGETTWAGGEETMIDHLLAHSVRYPLHISQSAALKLADSTLVGNGADPILHVDPVLNSSVHTWHADRAMTSDITTNGGLASTAGKLYAMAGGADPTIYTSTPGQDGALGAWTPAFRTPFEMPGTWGSVQRSVIAAGGNYLYQMHPFIATPDFGVFNGEVRAIAVAPNGNIYAGGSFTMIGGNYPANRIARWDGTQWSRLGTELSNGVDGVVHALTIVPNGDVYVGGRFDWAYDGTNIPAQNIARWNGSQWLTLGEAVVDGNGVSGENTTGSSHLPGTVYALAHDSQGIVFVGGSFRHFHETLNTYLNGQGHVYNFALYHPTLWPTFGTWRRWNSDVGGNSSSIQSLVWSGGRLIGEWVYRDGHDVFEYGRLYAGGVFQSAYGASVLNVAYYEKSDPFYPPQWFRVGAGIDVPVTDLALAGATGNLYAMSDGAAGVFQWDGSTWSTISTGDSYVSALTADARGNVYAGMIANRSHGIAYEVRVLRAGGLNFDWLGDETAQVLDLAVHSLLPDRAGQVLVGRGGSATGGIRRWSLEGLFRRNLSGATWEWFPYPIAFGKSGLPVAVAADEAGNLYAAARFSDYYLVYRLNAGSPNWELRASLSWEDEDPALEYTLANLVSADGYLYALAYSSSEEWYLYRHDPASPSLGGGDIGPSVNWTQIGLTPLPSGASTASSRSWTWDGRDSIYVLQSTGAYRYRISANAWDVLAAPSISFTLSQVPVLARAGNNLYVYATPGPSVPTNLFRYGEVGMPDVRLTIERTALVEPDSGSRFDWTDLSSPGGSYRFQIDAGASNAWVGPGSASWSPALPAGAVRLTSAQADFMAPEDGLYRLGASSLLAAGYHRYVGVAHVYPSQAACVECASGSLAWNVDAFATVREAVESGAARVLVHPGRYPQTFYLVSGVEVIGSGAELTIIEAPAGQAASLVTAEGVAGASLSRMTLAGGASWDGFLAEGGTMGVKLMRAILRDLKTGVRLRDGSEVEIVNNTFVRNTDGLVAEGATPVNVRNTIFAYHSGAGLTHGDNPPPTSLSNIYNDFWLNGTDMSPSGVSLGSLFVDPRFRSLAQNDLRLSERSPLIDKGAPNDPTVSGGGERVDIGYAEYNAAGFYVSKDYSETSLNDGLSWGMDAFDRIQPALEAAAATLHGLQGAVPQGGYSVAVDTGIYTETVSVPSHVRLVGSGAEVTTINAGSSGSAVTFDGVIGSQLFGFNVQNAGGASVEIKGASSGITIERNVLRGNASHGVSLAGSSSAQVFFNTIIDNGAAAVYAAGAGTWVQVSNNILDGNAYGLQAASGGLIHNSFNLLNNTVNLDGVTRGDGTLEAEAAFLGTGHYVPSANSPAIDAADPLAPVPAAGGLRADLGYKELIACPLTVLFGPQIDSAVTGNAGIAQVEVGVALVNDASQPVIQTLPTNWETLTPNQAGQPLFYWTQSVSQATPGLYRVYSRATDAAGNRETEALDWYEGAFVVDDTPPTLSWGTPALPGSTSAAAVLAVIDVEGTLTTGAGTRNDLAQAYFNISGPAGQTNVPAEGGRAWILLPATGSYSIEAVAVDEAGNRTTRSTTLEVSASSSVATLSNYTENDSVNSTQITLRGYVRFTSAGGGSVAVSVSDGSTVQARLDAPGTQFSAWSAVISLPEGEGAKTVSITPSLDSANGNTTTLNLVLDTSAPTLNIAQPADGASQVQSVTFSGTASDAGSGLSKVEVSVDGGFTWQKAAVSASDWTLDWNLGAGQDYVSYPARVRAIDAAGNTTLIERVVRVDSTPPTGLDPVSFSQPVEQHLDLGTTLTIGWNAPVDAGGAAQVFLDVDKSADTLPTTLQSGERATANLNDTGDWYAHLMAQDALGNQVVYHYGPWHVRNLTTSFSERRESIIMDGFIDLAHDEWQATDLLGMDARSGHPQELYLSVDGQNVFLGWSGAWWTLDGTLWAYLDAATGGTDIRMDGSSLPLGTYADLAVEIRAPGDGSLWTWNGSSWAAGLLDFANGSSGDTEVRIPWSPSANQSLNLIAFALPRQDEVFQAQALDQSELLADSGAKLWAMAEDVQLLQEPTGPAPWAVFPTTNPLNESLSESFAWTQENLINPAGLNLNQPAARTVYMKISSPQASNAVLCQESEIVYDILLTNPEPVAISGLSLTLIPSGGLSYQDVSGATLGSDAGGSASWTLNAPALEAGASTHVIVTARIDPDLSNTTEVESTILLSAGTTALTPESEAMAILTHRTDGQAPALSIASLDGTAIASGTHTFTGSASDSAADGGAGSGVERVEVSVNGGGWATASGSLVWSLLADTPGETTTLTLSARAVDRCGYTSTVEERTFIVDTTPPAVTWSAPVAFTGALATISGTAYDPAPAGGLVQLVEVQMDEETSAWRPATGPFAPQNGAQGWTWSWLASQEDGVTHMLRVRATDAVGNTTVTGWQETVVDMVAPQLIVTHPQDSSIITMDPSGDPALTGTVIDGSGVQDVTILVYDHLGGISTQPAAVTGEVWTYSPDVSDWSIGTYTLRVQAVDIYGNMRMVGPYLFELTDTPIVGLEATNDGPRMLGDSVTFIATITAGSNVTYSWDFGDGATAEGQEVTHAYNEPRDYTATVTANNSASKMSVTTTVTILDLSVDAGEDQSAEEGQAVTVNAAFIDSRAEITHSATIDWGDNTTPTAGEVDEEAHRISGSHAFADNGTYTVTVTIRDELGHTTFDRLEITVSNVAPVVDAGEDVNIDEGTPFNISVSFTDPGADTWEATVDYGDGSGVLPLTLTGKEFDLSYLYADDGSYAITVCVTDDDGDMGCDDVQVTVYNLAPGVTASPDSQTVQYSEAITEITFTAIDVSVDTMEAGLSWRSDGTIFQSDSPFAGLTLSDGGCTEAGGSNTCTWRVMGNVYMPAGSYILRLTVTDKDGGSTNTDATLIVEPEQAAVTFDGANPVTVQVAAAGGSSGLFYLRVCVSERDVLMPGDISLAQVSMILAPVGPGGPVEGTTGERTVENGIQCLTFGFNEVPVNTYTVQVTVGGGYYAGAGEDVLVVYDPSLGFTSGGGWFYWPDTANAETGYPGDRTNFGYTMKYNKKATNIQGNLLLIRHLPDDTIYRVKSNALYGLALGEDPQVPLGWASFSGKSTYQEPGWPEPIGNYEFLTYVEDRNEPGSEMDRFWIEVLGGLAMQRPATDNTVPLEGGNLVVPHRAR